MILTFFPSRALTLRLSPTPCPFRRLILILASP
jgi:hypothetical protein